jgi:S-adenosylmethionine-diacylgycerolhomoserine-N-methlytransferase
LENLKPGGELFMVDFYDLEDLPGSFRKLLQWWLSKFHVTFWEGLMPYLHSLESKGRCKVTISPLFRRYSFLATIKKNS